MKKIEIAKRGMKRCKSVSGFETRCQRIDGHIGSHFHKDGPITDRWPHKKTKEPQP